MTANLSPIGNKVCKNNKDKNDGWLRLVQRQILQTHSLKKNPPKTHTHGSLQYESLSEMASCDSMVDCFIKLIAKKKNHKVPETRKLPADKSECEPFRL